MSRRTEKRRVYIPGGYIHIDDPVAVLRSEQIDRAQKTDRGTETPGLDLIFVYNVVYNIVYNKTNQK